MNLHACFRTGLVLIVAVLLTSCATTPPGESRSDASRVQRYEARADDLTARRDWTLKGRLAVSDANDGGSGNLQWQENLQGTRMDFHGALGRGAWRLEVNDRGAELELADGTLYRADEVQSLVREQIGWEVPIEALAWWVRGLEAPGAVESHRLGDDGTLEFLDQLGWEIEFSHYRDVGRTSLPLRLTARQAGRTVKLVVRNWSLGARHD